MIIHNNNLSFNIVYYLIQVKTISQKIDKSNNDFMNNLLLNRFVLLINVHS